jgi:hypothetical protein
VQVAVFTGTKGMSRTIVSVQELEFSLNTLHEKDLRVTFFDLLDDFDQNQDWSKFDAFIMHSTFLGAILSKSTLSYLISKFRFIREFKGVKIALPQDDYYCTDILNALIIYWGIQYVGTPLYEERELLYKEVINRCVSTEFFPTFTGYVTPRIRRLTSIASDYDAREFDVVYRASNQPMFPNLFGEQKAELGSIFNSAMKSHSGFRLDVSSADFLNGNRWFKLLNSSKFTLGALSGSSIIIRDHSIIDKITEIQPRKSTNPAVTSLLNLNDQNLNLTALSPRNIESAMLNTGQILLGGSYSGLLQPNIHFLPIEIASIQNQVDSICISLRSRATYNKLTSSAKEVFWYSPTIQIESLNQELLSKIGKGLPKGYGLSTYDSLDLETRLLLDAKENTNDISTVETSRQTNFIRLKNKFLKFAQSVTSTTPY